MKRVVLFAIALFLVAIGVPACAKNPPAPTSPTVEQTPAPVTNPTVELSPAPVTNPTVAVAPTPLTNPTVAPIPASATPPTVAPAPAPAANPTIAQVPTAAPNPTVAPTPALINPTGGLPDVAPNVQPDLPANAKTDEILDALDQTGKKMKEFTAKVGLTEGDPNFGDLKTSIGKIWFQKKGDDDGRIRVTFDKRKVGENFRNEKVEYLLDNGLLIDRNWVKLNEDRRQVIKPGDKINLLKLGEGPFPLPIGQKKEDVLKEFDVKLAQPEKNTDPDLADTIHLQLTPKAGARFAKRFGTIDIWVNRKSKFPVQIITVAPDGSDQKITKLTDVQVNPAGGLKDADFTLQPIDEKTWGIHTEGYAE